MIYCYNQDSCNSIYTNDCDCKKIILSDDDMTVNPTDDDPLGAFDKFTGVGIYQDTENTKWNSQFIPFKERNLPYGPHEYGYNDLTCYLACKNFQYFGIQDDSWCSCGNDLEKATQYGGDACWQYKAGGGPWCNYIFEII